MMTKLTYVNSPEPRWLPLNQTSYHCPKCRTLKLATEFASWRDETRLMIWCRDCRSKYPFPIPDFYLKHLIRQHTNLPATIKIPKWLLAAKRAALQMRRLAAEREAYENHKRHS